jgi:hypothetical protein
MLERKIIQSDKSVKPDNRDAISDKKKTPPGCDGVFGGDWELPS